MLRSVMLAGLFGVMFRVGMVAMREMGMVCGFLVIAGFMVFDGGPVMPGGVFMMFCGTAMMFSGFFRHGKNLR